MALCWDIQVRSLLSVESSTIFLHFPPLLQALEATMNYLFTKHNNTFVIFLEGSLDYTCHNKFNEILELTKTCNFENLLLDVSSLNFIDSSGIGILITLSFQASKQDIKLRVCGAHDQVLDAFSITKLPLFLQIENSDISGRINDNNLALKSLEPEFNIIDIEDKMINMMLAVFVDVLNSKFCRDSITMMLYCIYEFVKVQFKNEEVIMEELTYENRLDHILAHNEFLEVVEGLISIIEICQNEDDFDSFEVSKYVISWIDAHRLNHDNRLRIFLKKSNLL